MVIWASLRECLIPHLEGVLVVLRDRLSLTQRGSLQPCSNGQTDEHSRRQLIVQVSLCIIYFRMNFIILDSIFFKISIFWKCETDYVTDPAGIVVPNQPLREVKGQLQGRTRHQPQPSGMRQKKS